MAVDAPQLVAHVRPSPPDGPHVIAALGRAGRAAAEALLETRPSESVRVWDPGRRPETTSVRKELERRGVVVADTNMRSC